MSAQYSTLSVIVPCFNEQESLPHFYAAITKAADELPELEFELVFIDDGSHDGTLEILKQLHQCDRRVRYISFSRNFGKEAALYAGFQNCNGDLITVMDADLQDPPALLSEMYRAIADEGYDVVATRRSDRNGEPPVRSFFAHCFYRLINRLSTADIVDGARDFRMMKRCVRDAILSMGEYNRFSKGIFGWVGFKTKWLSYENIERVAGVTKWSFWKLFKYSLEGIFAFTTAPLAVAMVLGILLCLIGIVAFIALAIGAGASGAAISGFGGIACLIAFVGGLQLMAIGLIGQYLGRMYMEDKKRPIYIVRETEDEQRD